MSTVAALLEARAAASGSAPFLVFEGDDGSVVTRSYSEMLERARRAAGWLSQRGMGRGDRVHLHMPNHPGFFDAWFGCAFAGAVMVPTNPLLTASELTYEIEHSRSTLSITTPELEPVVSEAGGTVVDLMSFDAELTDSDPVEGAELAPTDVLGVLYTSGTTSRPKGVLVTHANYLHVGRVVAEHLEMTADDRWLVVLPLFHANAQYYSTMSALHAGASVAVMSRFSASLWPHQAARHGATLASLFAAPIRMILAQRFENIPANRLRAATFSQNVTETQLADFEERFDVPLLQLYGMTETMAPPTLNPLSGPRRNMSIGPPTAGASIRLVDETGTNVADGEVGEMLVEGTPGVTLMAGYLDDPKATARALRDGWLHTGDMARRDGDGYLYFVDRAKDMIKRAGENVSAGEIEAVADQHPAVQESAAIGISDEMRDEAIVLVCVLRDGSDATEADILQWCGSRLARFKVPSSVHFVERLPRTSVGKVQKEILRRSLAAR